MVAVHGQPLGATHGDLVVGLILVAPFDHMNVLDAEAFAATQAGTGIVRLIDVFEDNSEMAGSLIENRGDLFLLVGSDIVPQEFDQFFVGSHEVAPGDQPCQRGRFTPM